MATAGIPSLRTPTEVLAFHEARPKKRGIANNTYLEDVTATGYKIRLHSTDIVTWEEVGFNEWRCTLNNGGWDTITTRKRINLYTPADVNLFSELGCSILYFRPGYMPYAIFLTSPRIHEYVFESGINFLYNTERNKISEKPSEAYLHPTVDWHMKRLATYLEKKLIPDMVTIAERIRTRSFTSAEDLFTVNGALDFNCIKDVKDDHHCLQYLISSYNKTRDDNASSLNTLKAKLSEIHTQLAHYEASQQALKNIKEKVEHLEALETLHSGENFIGDLDTDDLW